MHGRLEIPNLSSSVEKYFTRTFERRERDEKFRISTAMSYPLFIRTMRTSLPGTTAEL